MARKTTAFSIRVSGHPIRYITDSMEILRVPSEVWSGHWKVDDPNLTSEARQTIQKAVAALRAQPAQARKTFAPAGRRAAANNFKRTHL